MDGQTRRDVLKVAGAAGAHGSRHEVRATAGGDEHLGAVHDVVIAVPHGLGAKVRDVAAGVGLGDREGGDLVAADDGIHEALLLLGGADADGIGGYLVRHRKRDQG